MSDNCKTCNLKIGSRALKVKCRSCDRAFHASCVGMSKEDVEGINASDFVWRCGPCQREHRASMNFSQALDTSVTLSDILERLETIRKEQKGMEQSLGKSLDECYKRIDDMLEEVKQTKEAVEKQNKEMELIRSENTMLKKQVTQLEQRIEDCEQYSRRSCVEVFGVPEVEAENVLQTVSQVGKAIGITIKPEMIDACHRLPKSKTDPRPRGIIIKFLRRFDKEEFIKKKRSVKNLTAKEVGFASSSPVYVNESLTPHRRALLRAARGARKTAGYKHLWTFNGRILLRKDDNSEVVVIDTMEDVNKIK